MLRSLVAWLLYSLAYMQPVVVGVSRSEEASFADTEPVASDADMAGPPRRAASAGMLRTTSAAVKLFDQSPSKRSVGCQAASQPAHMPPFRMAAGPSGTGFVPYFTVPMFSGAPAGQPTGDAAASAAGNPVAAAPQQQVPPSADSGVANGLSYTEAARNALSRYVPQLAAVGSGGGAPSAGELANVLRQLLLQRLSTTAAQLQSGGLHAPATQGAGSAAGPGQSVQPFATPERNQLSAGSSLFPSPGGSPFTGNAALPKSPLFLSSANAVPGSQDFKYSSLDEVMGYLEHKRSAAEARSPLLPA